MLMMVNQRCSAERRITRGCTPTKRSTALSRPILVTDLASFYRLIAFRG